MHTSCSMIFPNGVKFTKNLNVSDDELLYLDDDDVSRDKLVIPEQDLIEVVQEWKHSLIGKFLGRRIDPELLSRELRKRWQTKDKFETFALSHGIYIFKFVSVEDLERVRIGGPWVVSGQVLALEGWREGFIPSKDAIRKAAVWVRLPDLPVECWARKAILRFAMRAGRPLAVDECTEKGFARVCVEVDLLKPLVPGVTVGLRGVEYWQTFAYENIAVFCFNCGMIGHRKAECLLRKRKRDQSKEVVIVVRDMNDDDYVDDDDDVPMSYGSRVSSRGLTGLHNIGNTCFMNTALQCLVHTPNLVRFFLRDYTLEINKYNPRGTRGKLATAFEDLLRKLWYSGAKAIAPCAFKTKLARFAPEFSGYDQHDSQELLAFLLDGLHEDLNRATNRPYIEAKDANGRSDEEFADECWKNYKARNDSIIVDVCQGQYKSTLVCPVCSEVSVTFDPFMYLSLPLPFTRTMTVTVFSGDGSALPMFITVTVPENGTCRDLSRALNVACSLKSSEYLLLAKVFENRISHYLGHCHSLSDISDEDYLVAYKLPANYKDFVRLELMPCRTERLLKPEYELLGTPVVTCLSKEAKTGADIHTAICKLLSPLLRVNAPKKHAKISKESGYFSSSSAEYSNPSSSDTEYSDSDMEKEKEDDGCPSFQLAFTNEWGSSSVTIDNKSSLPSGSCVRVLLEWSDKIQELYDINFLEDLPEVSAPFGSMEETFTLFSCFDAFLKEETLGPDDMWYCPGCKEHRQATKKLDLWRLPEILVVHLKRFSYSRYRKTKLDTFVNFPLHNLDLSEYVKHNSAAARKSHLYELYAVSNHSGGLLDGGHYSAYAKLIEEDSWYHFDDDNVSPASEYSIKKPAAYVLFYRRVDVDTETP